MLMIRLSRVGKKHHPLYRVVISEKRKDTVGDYLELLGQYDPHTNTANLKAERIQYWISKGAQTSGTVHNLLVHYKIITGEKIKVANIKRQKKTDNKEDPGTEKKEEAKTAKPDDNKPNESVKEEPVKEKSEDKKPESPAKPTETDDKEDKKEESEGKK